MEDGYGNIAKGGMFGVTLKRRQPVVRSNLIMVCAKIAEIDVIVLGALILNIL